VGCAGWEYNDWIGPFYPKKMKNSDHLSFYAKFFDFIEINSTFYNLPNKETVERWNEIVPPSFEYAVKIWQDITHDAKGIDLESKLNQFFYRMEPLKEKICAILLQFPPWFKYSKKHLSHLLSIINESPPEHMLVFELRDNSWFEKAILSRVIDGTRTVLGTSYLEGVIPYFHPAQNSYYIRLFGDRQLNKFHRVQRTQENIIADLERELHSLEKTSIDLDIFIIVNNHFTGYSPETVNILKKRWGLPTREHDKQKKLSDFF